MKPRAPSPIQHHAGHGLLAAARSLPVGIPKAISEFKALNTRESRAAFADHWIGIWARDFDETWAVIYQLLKIVEEDELYKDPRRVGQGAPGFPKETHGERSSYPDFAAYFTDRVKQPLDRWADLERTYQYAQRYAPEIFELPLSEAGKLAAANHAGPGRGHKTGVNNTGFPRGATRTAYIRARLERDGYTEELAAIDRGEITTNAVAIKLGWRARMVQIQPTVEGFARAAKKHLSAEDRRQLAEQMQ